MSTMSLVSWLQNVDHSKGSLKKYRSGNTLVGVKVFSLQHLLLHKPHTSLSELQHPDYDNLPLHLQWFVAATDHLPEFWDNDEMITEHFHQQGHRDMYIKTFLAYLKTLADTYFLWRMQILCPLSIEYCSTDGSDCFTLDIHQQTIQNHVLSSVTKRNELFNF